MQSSSLILFNLKMSKGCWKFDVHDKALYIDVEEESDEVKQTAKYSSWNYLPDIILEEIFSHLTIRERYYASLVCRSWYHAFKLQKVWSTFTLQDTTLTRGKFNYYSGWEYVLDHMRTTMCLNKVGKNFRILIFEPMLNFYNLFEFMNMISWYAERQGSDNTSVAGVGTLIRRLKFTFPCNMANRDDPERIRVFGTGGKLLEALKRLMSNLANLKCLELIDLMLDNAEAVHLLDEVCAACTESLRKLVLINTTRHKCPLIHVGMFLNLNILVISPQNLHEDVIELIGYTKLRHLHIVQNRYSPVDATIQLPKCNSWLRMKENNPFLSVHFEIESSKPVDFVLPIDVFAEHSAIPCQSIIMDNPNTKHSAFTLMTHGAYFDTTLQVYAFKGLSRYYQHKNFAKRLDEALIRFCKSCPKLHTLMIRDKVSTATILEIASITKNLRYLYVRRNVILKRCDKAWLSINNWTPQHYQWIKMNSRSYEDTEREVSKILGYRWHMLTEKEFKNQHLEIYT